MLYFPCLLLIFKYFYVEHRSFQSLVYVSWILCIMYAITWFSTYMREGSRAISKFSLLDTECFETSCRTVNIRYNYRGQRYYSKLLFQVQWILCHLIIIPVSPFTFYSLTLHVYPHFRWKLPSVYWAKKSIIVGWYLEEFKFQELFIILQLHFYNSVLFVLS